MGDADKPRDQIQLRFEPEQTTRLSTKSTVAAGQFHRETYVVEVHDGQLNLDLSDLGGVTGRALINALLISPTPLPLDSADEEWIELYNRSDHTVDLGGWQIDDAVQFDFPSRHVDRRLASIWWWRRTRRHWQPSTRHWPAACVGDLSGNLSNMDDRIQLDRPSWATRPTKSTTTTAVAGRRRPTEVVRAWNSAIRTPTTRWRRHGPPAGSDGLRLADLPLPRHGGRTARREQPARLSRVGPGAARRG